MKHQDVGPLREHQGEVLELLCLEPSTGLQGISRDEPDAANPEAVAFDDFGIQHLRIDQALHRTNVVVVSRDAEGPAECSRECGPHGLHVAEAATTVGLGHREEVASENGAAGREVRYFAFEGEGLEGLNDGDAEQRGLVRVRVRDDALQVCGRDDGADAVWQAIHGAPLEAQLTHLGAATASRVQIPQPEEGSGFDGVKTHAQPTPVAAEPDNSRHAETVVAIAHEQPALHQRLRNVEHRRRARLERDTRLDRLERERLCHRRELAQRFFFMG